MHETMLSIKKKQKDSRKTDNRQEKIRFKIKGENMLSTEKVTKKKSKIKEKTKTLSTKKYQRNKYKFYFQPIMIVSFICRS